MIVTDVSADDPVLQPYRSTRYFLSHFHQGIFVAEGEKIVTRLLQSPVRVQSILASPQWLHVAEKYSASRPDVPVYRMPHEQIRDLLGYDIHQSLFAVGAIPASPAITTVAEDSLLLALDRVNHSVNVGAMVRSAAALGVSGIITDDELSHPYLRRAIRASIGAVFHLPVYFVPSLPAALLELNKSYSTTLIVADPNAHAIIQEAGFSRHTCLIFGNEHQGVRGEILELPVQRVKIPMSGLTDSLNVAAAAAIFMYEAQRAKRRE